MKKVLNKISIILVAALMLCALVGCSFLEQFSKKPDPDLPKLAAPEVTIDGDGVASWGKVNYAVYYVYVIGSGEETPTDGTSVKLTENQSIKVKAVSGSEEYADSDFSQIKTYVKTDGKTTKLATPQVTIGTDGVATWAAIANAQYYVYAIDGGAEIMTTGRSVLLTENQSIKVKAGSSDVKYSDSDFSKSQTYVKTNPPATHTHTDADGNTVCDECGKSVITELSFYAVNDLHGKFMDTATQPGLDEFTTYLKNLYSDDKREEVLLASGDMWQGTVESSSNKGQLMTEWMNEAGFVSMTLGNHEYDWGPSVLTPNSKLADFPFLAINVTYNGQAVDYCQPSTTVEKGGVKIGIIGAIGDCLSSISGDFKTGLKFATGSALTSLVKTEANRLRNEEGCDFIVYSIHDGYESNLSYSSAQSVSSSEIDYYDTELSNGYVDLVFEAHTHKYYMIEDEHGVYHLQGGGENNYVSCADVSYNTVTKKYTVSPKLIYKTAYGNDSINDDPVVGELYEKYFPDSNPYTTVLGANTSQKDDTAICEKVARLYYDKGVEEWGSQYNIVLGGGFLKTRSPYNIAAGSVTYAQIFSVLPFDNDLVLGRISGSDLKSKFINSSNANYHCYYTVSASGISNSSYYYIVVDSYSSTYAPNNITEVARISGTYARDLLAEFVAAGGWGGY